MNNRDHPERLWGFSIGVLLVVCSLVFWQAAAETCLDCHRAQNKTLIAAWEKSRHAAAGLTCEACHGVAHDAGMAARARPTESCIRGGCHQREQGSHLLSKHGVIATLEGARLDYALPLKEGNQRAPSCAYCHMHDREHDAGAGILPLIPTREEKPDPSQAARMEARAAPCRDCHSPRFVESWFVSGDRMVEIGRMKRREAEALVVRYEDSKAKELLARMQEHLGNVRLGVGHASPDDQWWHGQPALDGDLLRIKTRIGELLSSGQP